MKDRITEQSIRLFEKKGFSETSIQDIVDSLGVTKGTFYYYFSSKEQLLMDIHMSYIEDMILRQERILYDSQKSCKEKLYEMVFMLISNIESQGPSARVFFREMRNLSADHLSEVIPKRDLFRQNLQKLLDEGKDKKEFKVELRSDIVAFGILGVTNWSYQWFNPNGLTPDEEVTRIFVDMILQGIE
ncbi:TetR/AcrR family transcriptional regulator [Bacillus sp. DJP31]|uniref:TetR/AcrR family transcriptional regulator n=1 Tax=Bacillus sp. DJP31 TaxID=3409789 RepID=UPI003BB627A1